MQAIFKSNRRTGFGSPPFARSFVAVALLGVACLTASPMAAVAAAPATCTADDFGLAVDEAGARLRAFNAEASPKLQAKLKALKDKKGWSGPDADDKSHDFLHDQRLDSLDEQANELLVNIDTLGRPPENQPPDCSKLDELRAASSELLTVMRTKSSYTIAKIEGEVGRSAAPTTPPPALPPPAAAPSPKPASPPPVAKPSPAPPARPSSPEVAQLPKPTPPASGGWSARTEVAPAPVAPPAPPTPPTTPADAFTPPPEDDGYTIDEIREVTRGVFGTISTELASVIEHAFRKSGRPTAYILGQEGGGAFLAGLRYGNGTLYPRRGGPRPIYWHGPSLGSDFGVAGSRALFLIYGLQDANAIHRRFTGIDGSAYLVGGVGLTFLKGGDVTMAPIRSGLGLRIGASIGYLRFSPKPTWNPF